MNGYRLNACVDEGLHDMIVVTGIFRSGTTMLGRVVGSLKGVEYAYEPPLLFYAQACAAEDSLDRRALLEWIKVYLYYDYFESYLLGRYNFRATDNGSCVLKFKPYEEALERWYSSKGPMDAILEKANGKTRFAFKFCNFYKVLALLIDEYPSVQILDLGRDLRRVLSSMMVKKWFCQVSLQADGAVMWPFHTISEKVRVPYLVREKDIDSWMEWNDLTRTAYMCCRFAEEKIAFKKDLSSKGVSKRNYLELSYEDIIDHPARAVDQIKHFTGLDSGALTPSITGGIQPTRAAFHHDELLTDCEEDVRTEFEALNQSLLCMDQEGTS